MKIVFLRVLGMSVTASFLIIALIAFRAMLKKAPRAMVCGLWVLAAVRLVCPFTVRSPFSILPGAVEEVTAKEWIEDQADSSVGLSGFRDYLDQSQTSDSPTLSHQANQSNESSDINWKTVLYAVLLSRLWVPVLTRLWMIGCLVMLSAAARSFLRIRRKVSVSIQIDSSIWICDYIKTPFVLGMIRPRIYLPSDMSAAHFRSVTAHERAHLQRGDHWWKPIAYLILSIHWFNPLVWLSYILFCRDIELACDERVVHSMDADEKKAYSEALLSLSLSHRLVSAAYPLNFGEVGVKKRIRTVLNQQKPALWAAALTLAGSAVLTACLMTNPAPEAVEAGLQELLPIAGNLQDLETAESLISADSWAHFLLLGLDGESDGYDGKRSDAVIILSVNQEAGRVVLSSVPRDMMVYTSRQDTSGYDKLCHAYAYGGAENVMKTFRENLDLDIAGYVTVNFQAMEDVIDRLGGLTLTLTDQEAKHMGEYYGAWGLEGGTQLLTGYEVLQYCRVRKIDSDYARNERQLTVLREIYEKVRELPVTDCLDLIETVYPHVSTSLSDEQCIALAQTILDLSADHEPENASLLDGGNSRPERIDGSSYILADSLADAAVRWREEVLGISGYSPSPRLQQLSDEMADQIRQAQERLMN